MAREKKLLRPQTVRSRRRALVRSRAIMKLRHDAQLYAIECAERLLQERCEHKTTHSSCDPYDRWTECDDCGKNSGWKRGEQ
jgi:hypothetical protein